MRQKATETIIQMSPQSDWSYGEDGWKNKTIYGNIQKAHDTFEFRVHGKVEIQPSKYEEKADRYQHSSYVSHQTGVSTSAEEAWHMGMGVCQDYAHIFIVLLRLAGIPARYVCGLLAGEGASHAWVEAFCEGRWIGLDPTNDCCVGNSHIKLGDGRDASECAINRGILIGGGIQQQDVCAVVK